MVAIATSWLGDLGMGHEFAARLREMRQRCKLTQTRLAQLLNVSPRVYNRWETGDATPHFDTIVRIGEILQVSLDELAGKADLSTESRIHNTELHRLCQEIDKLPDGDQQVVVTLMDSLIKKHKFERVLANQI